MFKKYLEFFKHKKYKRNNIFSYKISQSQPFVASSLI